MRGIAILLVLLLHFTLNLHSDRTDIGRLTDLILEAGWCGVDLFFALSGFLITGILLDSRDSPGYLRNFYWRRILRIFPLYYGALLFLFLIRPLAVGYLKHTTPLWLPNTAWFLAYLQNWHPGFRTDGALSLFWSLGVEEQFYFVWPFLVGMLNRRRLSWFCVILAICAPSLRVGAFFFSNHQDLAYTGTPMRADGLTLGALAAICIRDERLRTRVLRFLTPVQTAAVAIILSICLTSKSAAYGTPLMVSAGVSAYAVLFAGFVFRSALPDRQATLLLGSPFLRSLGKYSYGLYVIHPLIAGWCTAPIRTWFLTSPIYAQYPLEWLWYAVLLGVCWTIAWASWTFFESRFLRLRYRFGHTC